MARSPRNPQVGSDGFPGNVAKSKTIVSGLPLEARWGRARLGSKTPESHAGAVSQDKLVLRFLNESSASHPGMEELICNFAGSPRCIELRI